MTIKSVFVSYDKDGDMLEVLWALREGYFSPTADERVDKRLDDDGELIGFLIHDLSSMGAPLPMEFELTADVLAQDVVNVTASRAALELGVSDGRVRQLARQGRVRGAVKSGRDWLIPMPVELVPGRRGPVGVAKRSASPTQ